MEPRRREELWNLKCVRAGMRRSRSRHVPRVYARYAPLGVATVVIATALAVRVPTSARSAKPSAHTTRVLNVRDEGRLHYVRSSGEVVIDEGRASGSLPGWVKVRFLYNGEPTVSARFTIYAAGGSISARARGNLSSPTSPSPSFRGSMTITRGSGRFAHVRGGGEVYGVYYRRSYALTVQAFGKFPY
jgi:hypothetical protein